MTHRTPPASTRSPAEWPLVVVKLGGSLLRRPDWHQRLAGWLARQPAQRCHAMIVGGGAGADAVRAADRTQNLGDEHCHWLAIEAMQRNLEAVASRFPQSPVVSCFRQVWQCHQAAPLVWFDPLPFLRQETPWRGLPPLPHTWDVTSDSIAARVAHRLGMLPLVLLKSTLPPQSRSLADWAKAGFVDGYFPQAAAALSGCAVNLHDAACHHIAWCGEDCPAERL